MFVQHQLLGLLAGGQLLVLSHFVKVGLDGRRYDNLSTFFSLLPRSKEKKKFKMLIFDFLKIG